MIFVDNVKIFENFRFQSCGSRIKKDQLEIYMACFELTNCKFESLKLSEVNVAKLAKKIKVGYKRLR